MNTYVNGDDGKALIKLDPRTKLFIFLISGTVSLNCYKAVPSMIYGTVLCTVLALCGEKLFALKAYALLAVVIYFRYMMGINLNGSGILGMLCMSLSGIVIFSFPVMLSFVLVMRTTRISQFMAAFRAMHLPLKVIIPLAVVFRFVPSVSDEWNGIRKAMAFRGISMEPVDIIKSPLKTIEYVLIPLLFSCISVMEEMAAAALARGIESEGERSSFEKVKLGVMDYLIMAVFTGLLTYIMQVAKA